MTDEPLKCGEKTPLTPIPAENARRLALARTSTRRARSWHECPQVVDRRCRRRLPGRGRPRWKRGAASDGRVTGNSALHRVRRHRRAGGVRERPEPDRQPGSRPAPRARRSLLWRHRRRAELVRLRDRARRRGVRLRADLGQSRERWSQRQHQRLFGVPAEPAAGTRRHLRPAVLRRCASRAPPLYGSSPISPGLTYPDGAWTYAGGTPALPVDCRRDRRCSRREHPVGRGRHAQALHLDRDNTRATPAPTS